MLAGIVSFGACGGDEGDEAQATLVPTETAVSAATPTQSPATEAPVKPIGNTEQGKKTFDANCTRCHPGGNKGVGPSLIGTSKTDNGIRKQVKEGKGLTPSFPKLTDADIANVIAFIRSLE